MEYYSKKLNSNALQRCYNTAPSRIQQFLKAEIEFVKKHLSSNQTVLDLGCGYGRVTFELNNSVSKIIGIDISEDNILLAKEYGKQFPNCEFHVMDAQNLLFDDNIFDTTICVQNGISAFKINPEILLHEALRVTKPNGTILISTYSDQFWETRLEWFKQQAEMNLIGEIDWDKTKNGYIQCKDGFTADTFTKADFLKLVSHFNLQAEIIEIDKSSLFCRVMKG